MLVINEINWGLIMQRKMFIFVCGFYLSLFMWAINIDKVKSDKFGCVERIMQMFKMNFNFQILKTYIYRIKLY